MIADPAAVPDCLIESTCGHPLKSGDSFYAYRDSPSWHWNPDFTGGPYGKAASTEILCQSCHDTRAQVT